MIVSGCIKEPNDSPTQASKSEVTEKSAYSNLEKIGMAADFSRIDYTQGQYNITLYNTVDNYTARIETFKPDSIVELFISDGNSTSRSIIDFQVGTVDIENDRLYKFSDLDSAIVSSSTTTLFNITAVIVAHHSQVPQSSQSFVNNGSSDSFPEYAGRRCFWCSSSVTNEYFPGLCVDITTTTMFWFFESTSSGDTYAC